MPDSPAEDRIEMYWVYKPTDFFDEKIELPYGDCTFEIDAGRATVKMSAADFESRKRIRQALTEELVNYFRLWQLQTRKIFELGKSEVDRIHPDGTRKSAFKTASVKVILEILPPDRFVVGPDGIVQDIFEAKKKLVEAELPLSSDPHFRRMLRSYDRSITAPAEELFCLYEIWDALMDKFVGSAGVQSALNIAPATVQRFRDLTCNLPLKQGRHRGKHDVHQDAMSGELKEARKIARDMIEKYLKYLSDQQKAK